MTGADMNAREVKTMREGLADDANHITLKSGANIYVAHVETAVDIGDQKKYASIILDARLSIYEMAEFDNETADLFAYEILLRHGEDAETEVKVMPDSTGTDDDIEVKVTAPGSPYEVHTIILCWAKPQWLKGSIRKLKATMY